MPNHIRRGNSAIRYHNIDTSYAGRVCVTISQGFNCGVVEITMDPCCHPQIGLLHRSCVSTGNPSLHSPFGARPTRARVSAIVERLLRADGQASLDLADGLTVITRVSSSGPKRGLLVEESSGLSVYRSHRLTGSQLIRPMLLEEPSMSPLRPFQTDGVFWLSQTPKAILADDMGLGKTVQAIFAIRLLFNEGRAYSALVVCPKSLLANWEHELGKWAPELGKVRLVPRASIRNEAWKLVINASHVMLTSYEQIRNLPSILEETGVDIVVTDEAHRIRNISSQASRGIRRIRTSAFWALTGTPVERDPEDLATLLSILEPNRFSVADRRLHISSLRAQARPYFLRRHKADVLDELPDVWEHRQLLDLLPGQRESYDQQLIGTENADKESILTTINQLRTICDYDESSEESVKIDRIIEIIEDVIAAREKAVVFSYLLKPLNVLADRLKSQFGKASVLNLRGSMSVDERQGAIDQFSNRDDAQVLLCSLMVAGEGLTLTAANHVIF